MQLPWHCHPDHFTKCPRRFRNSFGDRTQHTDTGIEKGKRTIPHNEKMLKAASQKGLPRTISEKWLLMAKVGLPRSPKPPMPWLTGVALWIHWS